MKFKHSALLAGAAVTLFLSGCGADTGQAGLVGTPTLPATKFFVLGDGNDSDAVLGYTIGTGGATLTTTLNAGADNYFDAIAEDRSGNLYVLGYNDDLSVYQVAEYAGTANGSNVTPLRTITLPTAVDDDESIALDTNGNVFVSVEVYLPNSDSYQNEIMMFAPGQNSIPSQTVLTTRESYLATDANAKVYATQYDNSENYEVSVFAAGLTSSTPVRTIPLSGLNVRGLALDLSGNVYVTGYTYNQSTDDDVYGIAVFAPTDTTTPSRTISGTTTTLQQARSIAVDPTGAIFVVGGSVPPPPPVVGGPQPAESGSNSVLKFAADATGNVAPAATYSNIESYGVGLVLQ